LEIHGNYYEFILYINTHLFHLPATIYQRNENVYLNFWGENIFFCQLGLRWKWGNNIYHVLLQF